jgi:hypothetical protein
MWHCILQISFSSREEVYEGRLRDVAAAAMDYCIPFHLRELSTVEQSIHYSVTSAHAPSVHHRRLL